MLDPTTLAPEGCKPPDAVRKISPYERYILELEKRYPPYCLEAIIEGAGSIEASELAAAVRAASDANPGSRFVMRGNRWTDSGNYPPVVVIDPAEWRDDDPSSHALFSERLSSKHGPTSRVYLVPGERPKVIFRTTHATMDGQGFHFWMKEVFRALRGETPLGTNSFMTDDDVLADSLRGAKAIPVPPGDCRAPTGLRSGKTNDFVTKRIRIKTSGHALVARLAVALRDICALNGSPHARVLVPVDLRPNVDGIRTTCNLVSSLSIDVGRQETWPEVHGRLIEKLSNHAEADVHARVKIFNVIPRAILGWQAKRWHQNQMDRNAHMHTAILSDLGTINTDAFSTKHFAADNVIDLPLPQPGVPVSITAARNGDDVELLISMPRDLATDGRLDHFVQQLVDKLPAGHGGRPQLFSATSGLRRPSSVASVAENGDRLAALPGQFDLIRDQGHGPISNDYKNKTIHGLIQQAAKQHPNDIAIQFPGGAITYKDLDERSNQLARRLRKCGAQRNEPVAIIADRSVEFLIGMLAVMKSGAAYLPIDPDAPTQRQQLILEDAGVGIVLTKKNATKARWDGPKSLLLEDPSNYEESAESLEPVNRPSDLIYVIYTSGSTGKPKGVAVKHEGVVNQMFWRRKVFNLDGERLVWPFFTSVAFDLTGPSMMMPLICGDTIKVFGNDAYNTNVVKIAQDPDVNVLLGTPSHIRMLSNIDLSRSNLKIVATGGEELSTSLASDLHRKLDGKARIINEYGPTEASIMCSYYTYDPTRPTGTSVPIGTAIDNTHLYVLDEDMRPVGVGKPGELYIGGAGVARGYINRPEVNAKRFIDNPFRSGEKMFRTGDFVKWMAPDVLVFAGREDDQVKIRGHRIELGEVESVLSSHEKVKECVVVPKKINDEKKLAAYFVADEPLDPAELKIHMQRRLQSYMIPPAMIQVDALPMTINGKLDRRALPEPECICASPDGAEKKGVGNAQLADSIAAIWGDVLGIATETIPHDAGLDTLGGASLELMEILSRVSNTLLPEPKRSKVYEHMDDIVEEPTVDRMASCAKRILLAA